MDTLKAFNHGQKGFFGEGGEKMMGVETPPLDTPPGVCVLPQEIYML